MKKIIFLVVIMMFGTLLFAQEKRDAETIKKELSEVKEQISKLQGKAKVLQTEMDGLPGWKLGAFGTLGISSSQFKKWYSNTKPNLIEGYINITQNAYARLNREKFFWMNALDIQLSWKQSYDQDKDTKDKGLELKTDIFKLTSLYGYKLSEKFALSSLIDYRGTFVEDFADPSFLVLAVGLSWSPIDKLYVVANPLGYEFIFSNSEKDYQSSMGAKFLINYTHRIGKLNLHSDFTAFLSYKSTDYSNWTWKNTLSYNLWDFIGIGFNFGLRQNKQEVFNNKLTNYPSLKDTDNTLQYFWTFGLSYTL